MRKQIRLKTYIMQPIARFSPPTFLTGLILCLVFTLFAGNATAFAEEYYRVTLDDTKEVYMREAPSDGEIVGELHDGDEVMLIETKGDNRKVQLKDGTVGYMNSKFLKFNRNANPADKTEWEDPTPKILSSYVYNANNTYCFRPTIRTPGIVLLILGIILTLVIVFGFEYMNNTTYTLTSLSFLMTAGGSMLIFLGSLGVWNNFGGYLLNLVLLLIPLFAVYFNAMVYFGYTESMLDMDLDNIKPIFLWAIVITAALVGASLIFKWSFGKIVGIGYLVGLVGIAIYIFYKGFSRKELWAATIGAITFILAGCMILVSVTMYFLIALFMVVLAILVSAVLSRSDNDLSIKKEKNYLIDQYGNRIDGHLDGPFSFHGNDGRWYKRDTEHSPWYPE